MIQEPEWTPSTFPFLTAVQISTDSGRFYSCGEFKLSHNLILDLKRLFKSEKLIDVLLSLFLLYIYRINRDDWVAIAYYSPDQMLKRLIIELNPENDFCYVLHKVKKQMQKGKASLSSEFYPIAIFINDNFEVNQSPFNHLIKIAISPQTHSLNIYAHESINKFYIQEALSNIPHHLEALLQSIIKNKNEKISRLSLLPIEEREKIFTKWNQTEVDYPLQKTLHELFEEQVSKTSDSVALIFGQKKLTYKQLNIKVNQLAHYLLKQDIDINVPIAICMYRSFDLIIAILAILKIGGAYLPLDPSYPKNRLEFMLSNAKVSLLLSQRKILSELSWLRGLPRKNVNLFVFEEIAKAVDKQDKKNLKFKFKSTIAYIIYTSGSTGKPKGVSGTHQGMVNRLFWIWQTFPFLEHEICCHRKLLNFVDHVAEIFSPLLSGVPLVVFPHSNQTDIDELINDIDRFQITRLVVVPSLLAALLEQRPFPLEKLRCLKYVFSSGEALPAKWVKYFSELLPTCSLINLYGSSEVSADVTCFPAVARDNEGVLHYFWQGLREVISQSEIARRNLVTMPFIDIQTLKENFKNSKVPRLPTKFDDYQEFLNKNVLPYSINIGSSHFIGHMTSVLPSFTPSLEKLVAILNQNLVKIETSKSFTFLEREAIAMLHRCYYLESDEFYNQHIQNPNSILGVIVTGGTLANVTALWLARNVCFPPDKQFKGIAEEGFDEALKYYHHPDYVILCSPLAHYSIEKAASLLGIGKKHIHYLPSLDNEIVDVHATRDLIIKYKKQNVFIIALIGIVGATETGTIDPLDALNFIAKEFKIYFHVDAAFGGPLIFSEKYKHLLKGIEHADSITLCGHKQLYLPMGISICLFQNPEKPRAIYTEADYQARIDSFDFGKVSPEGSRPALSLLLHAALNLIGISGYEQLINKGINNAHYLKSLINACNAFELILEPTINIVNYRYIPRKFRENVSQGKITDSENNIIDENNILLQEQQFLHGETFVSRTCILSKKYSKKIVVLRAVLSNPLTTLEDIKAVIEDQLRIAAQTIEQELMVNFDIKQFDQKFEKYITPIGRPISNVKIYILDKCLQPIPPYVPGELYIGGVCLAQNYLNRPDLTEERFILNPFSQHNEKLFRSGDLGCYTFTGNIEYLGRLDDQIKLKAFRIELGEIQYVLEEFPNIDRTIVRLWEHKEKREIQALVAYYTLKDPHVLVNADDLKKHLEKFLPDDMVPTYYVYIKKIPLLPNGKLDKSKLPEPDIQKRILNNRYIKPNSGIEKQLATIWSDVLGISTIGVEDNYFELSGDSIRAIEIISLARNKGIQITVKQLFYYPTIKLLSQYVKRIKPNIIRKGKNQSKKRKSLDPYFLNLMKERKDIEEIYQLSPFQLGLLLYKFSHPEGDCYFTQNVQTLSGHVNPQILKKSWKFVIQQYSILRTSFYFEETEKFFQLVKKNADFSWKYLDWENTTDSERERALAKELQSERHHNFDLNKTPLLRITLIRLSAKLYRMIINFHHIILDGWSLGLITNAVRESYSAIKRGRKQFLDKKYSYRDFIIWLQNKEDPMPLFWSNYLKSIDSLTLLSEQYHREDKYNSEDENKVFYLNFGVFKTVDLTQFSRQQGLTLNSVIQGCIGWVISQYLCVDKVVLGVTVSGREIDLLGIDKIIGPIINTIPVCLIFDTEKGFVENFKKQQTDFRQLMEYGYVSLPELQQKARQYGIEKLFDTLFVFENYLEKTPEGKFDYQIIEEEEINWTEFPLTILALPKKELRIQFKYKTSLYSEKMIKQLAGHIEATLDRILETPNLPLKNLDLLTNQEKKQILFDWNQTQRYFPQDKTLHQLFEEQVEKNPDNIALIFESQKISYLELNQKANQLAHYLRKQGLMPEDIVAIMIDRSPELVISIFGVIKAGGAYLPLDPAYPVQRINYMLEDSQASLFISQKNVYEKIKTKFIPSLKVFLIDQECEIFSHELSGNPNHLTGPKNLLYVIYTSGSTGKPKGVMIEHRGVVNHVNWCIRICRLTEGYGSVVQTSISFDTTVASLFSPLLAGRYVILAPEKTGIEYLASLLNADAHFDLVKLTPTHLEGLEHLLAEQTVMQVSRHFIVAGEILTKAHLSMWKEDIEHNHFINDYGPTEASVACLAYEIPFNENLPDTIPIGRPLDNVEVYILDKYLKPVPLGIPGELFIGGVGLARGYLNRDDLTKEHFIENPFLSDDERVKRKAEGIDTRLYRSGDLVKYHFDGNILFLNRIDEQIKLRGYRIELGEIENTLMAQTEIKQAAIQLWEDAGHKSLVAYYTLKNQKKNIEYGEIRNRLAEFLPDYMLPSYYVCLDKFPLLVSGKIDRKALPAPDEKLRTRQMQLTLPRTDIEKKLVRIWSEVLRISPIGIEDNFFVLGGDSIQCIEVVSKARNLGIQITVKLIFDYPTIRSLSYYAKYVDLQKEVKTAEQGFVEGSVLLTPIQKWFFDSSFKSPMLYHQAELYRLKQPMNLLVVSQILRALGSYHDSFRLRFEKQRGQWREYYANITDEVIIPCGYIKLKKSKSLAQQLRPIYLKLKQRLNYIKGPIGQAALIEVSPKEQYLLIMIHHLAVDGVSWRIIGEDLELLYKQIKEGISLKPLNKTNSYRDWSEGLESYARELEKNKKVIDFWRRQSEIRQIPFDHILKKKPKLLSYSVRLNRGLTQQLLKNCHRAYHTEINDLLLTALVLALQEWTHLEEIGIYLEGHGREEILSSYDFGRTIGWFTSLFPVKLTNSADNDIGKSIKTIKEQLRRIPNKGLSYGVLRYLAKRSVQKLLINHRKPNIVFNYLGQMDSYARLDNQFQLELYSVNHNSDLIFPLSIDSQIRNEILQFKFTFNNGCFNLKNIEKLGHRYLFHLRRIIKHCNDQVDLGFTPSDFPLANLSQFQLDNLLNNKKDIEDLYTLSDMQATEVFEYLSEEKNDYCMQRIQLVKGEFDIKVYLKVWRKLLKSFSFFRTGFIWSDDTEILQFVKRNVKLPYKILDWSNKSQPWQETQLYKLIETERNIIFNLAEPPLLRLIIVKLGHRQYRVIRTLFSLDGWSTNIVENAILTVYRQLISKSPMQLNYSPPFRDYINWLIRQNRKQGLSFWEKYISQIERPSLLSDYYRQPEEYQYFEKSYQQYKFSFNERQSAALIKFSRDHALTLNTIILGIIGWVLCNYLDNNSITLGVILSGREMELEGVENIVGTLINLMPINLNFIENKTLLEHFYIIQKNFQELNKFSHISLRNLMKFTRDKNFGKLFDVLFIFENFPKKLEKANYHIIEESSYEKIKYPLTIFLEPSENIDLIFNYETAIFNHEMLDQLARHIDQVLDSLINSSNEKISSLKILNAEEIKNQLIGFNDNKAKITDNVTVIDLFERVVEKYPNNIAVSFNDNSLTYDELNKKANVLANYLKKTFHIMPEQIIALSLNRGLDLMVGLMAILKTGAAFIPIDPDYPKFRIKYLLEDSNTKLLLTISDFSKNLPLDDFTGNKIFIDTFFKNKLHKNILSSNIKSLYPKDTLASMKNLAYVIYTSGSTGTPKGVMIEHQAVVARLYGYIKTYNLIVGMNHLQATNLSFDAFVGETIRALCTGGNLEICPRNVLIDPQKLCNFLITKKINCLDVISSIAKHLLYYLKENNIHLKDIKNFSCGTESWNKQEFYELKEYLPKKSQLINTYGVAEATIDNLIYVYSKSNIKISNGNLPIGKPCPNVEAYILSSRKSLMPIGIPGELYIGGLGLARGYLNKKDLTAEKFIGNPFLSDDEYLFMKKNGIDTRLYKTGDLVKYLSDGNLLYLGRLDDQVKIRGYRIELGEIENTLLLHPSIDQTAVKLSDKNGVKQIVAYYSLKKNIDFIPTEDLKNHLKSFLPEYMIPNIFQHVKEMPLNPNGKIAKELLPPPYVNKKIKRLTNNVTNDLLLYTLAKIWSEVLNIDVNSIRLTDNFFALGGDSLLLLELMVKLKKLLPNINIVIQALFEYQTIQDFSNYIKTKKHNDLELINILPINYNPSISKLFLVHPGSGLAYAYEGLGKFINDFSILGISNPYFGQVNKSYRTLEEMAKDYIRFMKQVQPKGPYNIGGYSFGGNVAIEMVRQLAEKNEKISKIILVDTFPHFLYQIKDKVINSTNDFIVNLPSSVQKHFRYVEKLLKNYDQNNIKFNKQWKLTLVKAIKNKNLNRSLDNDDYGWVKFLKINRNKFQMESLFCGHYDIFEEEQLPGIAKIINKFMKN